VNDYRGSWTKSHSRSSRVGKTESREAEAQRSFSFALHGGAAPLRTDCHERAAAQSTSERRCDPAHPAVPDHDLRCTLYLSVGGTFELSVVNGRGALTGTDGTSFAVSSLGGATSRWQEPGATGLLLRASGAPLAAIDFANKGRVVLLRDLESPRRELLAAAAAALLLADLDGW
jgi:hypothetical protein